MDSATLLSLVLEGQTTLEVSLGGLGQPIQLVLSPTEVTRNDSVAVLAGPGGAQLQIHGRVSSWTGLSTDGLWRSFLAQSPNGAIGWIESTQDARRFVLEGKDPEAVGLTTGPWRFLPERPGASSPLDNLCGVLDEPDDGGGGLAGFGPAIRREFTIAVDADNEFRALFPDAQSLLDYLVAMYAAVDAFYERDAGFGLRLGLVRIWEEPDPFDAPDPLYEYRDWWIANGVNIPRDLAQLATGRRNLPYGGVAWVWGACSPTDGYSVAGLLTGRFGSATGPAPGNWDLDVVAHELGHNFGSKHTHYYGFDTCHQGQVRRGTIMSYCHSTTGGVANIDFWFHVFCADKMREFVAEVSCGLPDCNNNGLSDAEEIAAGAEIDSNGDGVIDACQDCDDDGVVDPVEIAGGAADDDLDGFPDDCQADCNGNGFPDRAECIFNPAIDLDGDGVPDECEPDCDGDGQPDCAQIILDMRFDLDRDARVDTCQDCNENGIPDGTELANAHGFWTVDGSGNAYELDARSGVRHRAVATGLTAATSVCGLRSGPMLVGGTDATGAGVIVQVSRPAGEVSAYCSGAPELEGGVVRMRLIGAERFTAGQFPQGQVAVCTPTRLVRLDAASGSVVWSSQLDLGGELLRSVAVDASEDPLILLAVTPTRVGSVGVAGVFSQLFAFDASAMDATDLAIMPSGHYAVTSKAADGVFRYTPNGQSLGRWDIYWSVSVLRTPRALVHAPRADALVVGRSDSPGYGLSGFNYQNAMFDGSVRSPVTETGALLDLAAAGASPHDTDHNLILDVCEGGLPADLDNDGAVGGSDLMLLLARWATSGVGGPGQRNADFDGSGFVAAPDLALLLSQWTG